MTTDHGASLPLATTAGNVPARAPAASVPAKVILFANTDWYLYNFRLPLLQALTAAGAEVVLFSPPGDYVRRLQNSGFRWVPVEMQRRSLNPIGQLALLWRLYLLFRRERPAVVHLFTVKCVALGGIAARLAHVPKRIHAIAGLGSVFTAKRHRWLREIVTRALRLAMAGRGSQLIVQNPDDARLITAAGILAADKVELIRGSGVDGARFRRPADAQTDRPDGKPVNVLFAARLLWAKGVREYVRAAAALHDKPAQFLLAGTPDNGNPDTVDDAFLADCARQSNVDVLGHVEDMAALLQRVDLVVLPSRYGEGVPRILVEAAAAGLPLVAFDVAGSREIVRHGHNGYLVEVGDQLALNSAIANLLSAAPLRRAFGEASRTHFDSEYDQRVVVGKTLAVYAAT